MEWSYWLLTLGLALMVIDLTCAGLVQADLWRQHLPWIESVRALRIYWILRSVDGSVPIAGLLVFAASFFGGERHARQPSASTQTAGHSHLAGNPRTDRWIATAPATVLTPGSIEGRRRISTK
jgi:cbb3-type cytochrome oxidase subunit 1